MKYLLALFLTSCCNTKERDCHGQEDKIHKLVKECVAEAKSKIDGDYEYRRVLGECMEQYKKLYCPYKNKRRR